ncbi:MAG TPA: phosphatase PAP2 family protein [Solirubrobacter sp.]|nr:phosphatase PAP2 family protein [Solirubrobacter sp.]
MLAATTLPRPTSVLPFSARARTQVGLFLFAYLLYSAARFVTIGDLGAARAHAAWIVSLEQTFGVGVEASVQAAFTGTWMLWVLNHLYLVAQLGVIPAALIFLYRRAPGIYVTLRNTILATWLISVPVYGLFPVAPPRLAGIGIADTISAQTGFSLSSGLTTSFYNQLAAVPSLHVGFALAVGVALFAALRNPVLRVLALLWGPLIGLAVVATGNHFVFDMLAGVVACVAGYGLGAVAGRIRVRPTLRIARAFTEA